MSDPYEDADDREEYSGCTGMVVAVAITAVGAAVTLGLAWWLAPGFRAWLSRVIR